MSTNVLEEEDVRVIFERLQRGESGVKIANDFAMSPQAVSSIKTGQTWGHVTGKEYAPRCRGPRSPGLTEDQVLDIHEALNRGVKARELAPEYGVTHSVIYNIAIGKTWGRITGRD